MALNISATATARIGEKLSLRVSAKNVSDYGLIVHLQFGPDSLLQLDASGPDNTPAKLYPPDMMLMILSRSYKALKPGETFEQDMPFTIISVGEECPKEQRCLVVHMPGKYRIRAWYAANSTDYRGKHLPVQWWHAPFVRLWCGKMTSDEITIDVRQREGQFHQP